MLSQTVLDVPPRIRLLLIIAGMIGIGLIGMESLVGNRPETVPIDKIIHFSGYSVLACVFVLGLRPALFVPLLLTLVAMGMTIEFLQTLTGRQFDPADQYANILGVAVGGAVGLLLRSGYAYLRRELATAQVRRRLRVFPPGHTIFRQGDPAPHLYIIKSGQVRLTREVDGAAVDLAVFEPGEVIGAVAAIQGLPAYGTAKAVTRATLYRMNLEQLMDSAGGREQPVSTVLRLLARYVRDAADQLLETRVRLSDTDAPPARAVGLRQD
jgi:CRP-like cAMP-binding protein